MLDCVVHCIVHYYFFRSLGNHNPLASSVAAATVVVNPLLLWMQHGHHNAFTKYRNVLVAGQRMAAVYLVVACFPLSTMELVLPRAVPVGLRVLVLCGALPLTACNLLMELPIAWEVVSGSVGFFILAVNSRRLCVSLQDHGPLLQGMAARTAKLLHLVMLPVVQLPHDYVFPLLKCRALCMFYQILFGYCLPMSIVVIVQNRHLYTYYGLAPIGPHAREVLRQRHRFWGAPTYFHVLLLCLVLSTTAVTSWFLLCIVQVMAKWQ
jgi:hypothetical protein